MTQSYGDANGVYGTSYLMNEYFFSCYLYNLCCLCFGYIVYLLVACNLDASTIHEKLFRAYHASKVRDNTYHKTMNAC